VRLIELLVALILSKFVIVAVLSLAGAAYGSSGSPTATRLLTAMTLVLLATFAPWVMLRLLPFTELAAGAAGGIRGEVPRLANIPREVRRTADTVAGRAESLSHFLRRQAGAPEADEPLSRGDAGHSAAASSATARLSGRASRAADEEGFDEVPIDPAESRSEAGGENESSTPRRAPGDEGHGPFGQMERMWQFEALTPSWASLDGDGVRRVAGPESPLGRVPHGSEQEDPRPVDPGPMDPGPIEPGPVDPGPSDPGPDEPR
jgi:hypothetical protein